MAQDSGTGEKTEEATPKRKKEARDDGNVFKSQEVVYVAGLLIMFSVLRAMAPSMVRNLMVLMTGYLDGSANVEILTNANAAFIFQNTAYGYLQVVLPILLVGVAVGIGLHVMQSGFLFTTKAFMPKLSKLNPLEGIKKLFSSRVLFELLKNVLKISLIGYIIFLNIQKNLAIFPTLMTGNIYGVVNQVVAMVFDAVYQILMVMAAVAMLDFIYQRRKYRKDLMMSKYDVKMEHKNQEGDPQIKGKIKQKQREMSMMRMMSSVPDADVVITNPTEYAIALKYDESVGDAPVVSAKGKEHIARKIKEVARENYIPIVENKPLARSLYVMCEVGDFIPVEMYQAVAEILAEIFRAKNRR